MKNREFYRETLVLVQFINFSPQDYKSNIRKYFDFLLFNNKVLRNPIFFPKNKFSIFGEYLYEKIVLVKSSLFLSPSSYEVELRIVHDSAKGIWGESSCDVNRGRRSSDFQSVIFIFELQSFLKQNSFNSGSIAIRILLHFTMSSTSSHLETSFDSGDSEISFIAGYEMNPIRIYPVYHNRDNPKPRVSLAMTKLLPMLTTQRTQKGQRYTKGK